MNNFTWNRVGLIATEIGNLNHSLINKAAETKKKTQVKQTDNTQPVKASKVPVQLLKIQKKGSRAMTAGDSLLPEDIPSSDDTLTEKSTCISNGEEKKSESRKDSSKGMISLSREDLKRAVVMSVILGPPVSRRRKGYEGYTGRR